MPGMSRVSFTLHNALTQWQWSPFSLFALAAVLAAGYWYLRADWMLAARGRKWSRWRTAAFLSGLFAVDLALQSPVATFTGTYFQAHVAQHLFLLVVAPPLLALGAPSTLLLQTSSRRTKRIWLSVLRSRAFAALTFPPVVWFLYFGVMFAFFLSSLINVAMHHMALMDLMNVIFLFGGTLYWWPMVGADPIVHWRMGHGARMLNILIGGPPEVILGLAILSSRTPIASMYSLSSTHAGGALLWISTEFAVLGGFLPIFWQWTRSEERAAARADARGRALMAQPAAGQSAAALLLEPGGPGLSNWEAMWRARTGAVPYTREDGHWVLGQPGPARVVAPPAAPKRSRSDQMPSAVPEAWLDDLEPFGFQDPERPARQDPQRPAWSPKRRKRTRRLLTAAVVIVLLAVAGPAVFFHFVEGRAPAPLHVPTAADVSGGLAAAAGGVNGTWTVGKGSQGGYRVQEILLGQHHTAVGRTPHVTGSLTISGTTVTAAEFSLAMGSVKSDQPSRDAQFDGYIMEPYKYSRGTFRLTEPIQLGSIPAVGKPINAQATGALTLRGVTRSVSFQVQAERLSSGIDLSAQIPITFGLWKIPNPSFAVAEVGNTGIIEVLLVLAAASK